MKTCKSHLPGKPSSRFGVVLGAACFLALVLPVRSSAQTTEQPPATAAPASPDRASAGGKPLQSNDPTLKLSIGDLVEMTVYNVPELSTKTRVATNGDLYLPLVSHVHVAGLTIEEAQELIEARLTDGHYLKDPHVALFVDEYAAAGASILGEVSKPGIYPVLGQEHLFDLISIAGGLTEKAGHGIVITHRSDPTNSVTIPMTRSLADNAKDNVQVYPGDTIIVQKADIAYVIGDVGRPSAFLMDRGTLTVMQAISLAGGTNRTAKMNSTHILRKGPAGLTDVPVLLKKIQQAKSPDIVLQPDDILVVPSSAGKILAGRTLEAAIQAATLVSVAAF
jgi:polysaccharide export outer membrane protein